MQTKYHYIKRIFWKSLTHSNSASWQIETSRIKSLHRILDVQQARQGLAILSQIRSVRFRKRITLSNFLFNNCVSTKACVKLFCKRAIFSTFSSMTVFHWMYIVEQILVYLSFIWFIYSFYLIYSFFFFLFFVWYFVSV